MKPGITPPFQRNEKDWSVQSVYSIPPFMWRNKNTKLCSSSHMNQFEPPSGNVCWSFQVPFQLGEREGEGQIKLERVQEATDRGRETTSWEVVHVAYLLRIQYEFLWCSCFLGTRWAIISNLRMSFCQIRKGQGWGGPASLILCCQECWYIYCNVVDAVRSMGSAQTST